MVFIRKNNQKLCGTENGKEKERKEMKRNQVIKNKKQENKE